jgi:hypothetical protein
MLNKYIAIEYFGLQPSSNPQSITYTGITSALDLDLMEERIPVPTR